MSFKNLLMIAAGLALTFGTMITDAQAAGRFGGGSAGCYYNCPPPPPPPPGNGNSNAKHSSTGA